MSQSHSPINYQAALITRALLPSPHCSVQMQHAADELMLIADNDWHEDLPCMYLFHHELESFQIIIVIVVTITVISIIIIIIIIITVIDIVTGMMQAVGSLQAGLSHFGAAVSSPGSPL